MKEYNTINNSTSSTNDHGELLLVKKIKPASEGKRLLNYVIDMITIFILFLVFYLVDPQLYIVFEKHTFLFPVLSLVVYYSICETLWQKTLGKLITNTKVVTSDGKIPDFINIIGRSFLRLIPFEPFSFLGDSSIGWHDNLSKTLVVNDSE